MEMQAVKTKLNHAFNFCVSNIKYVSAQAYTYGTHAITYVSPKIAELASRIHRMQIPSFVKQTAAFACTNAGMSALAVGGAVTSFVMAEKVQNRFIKVTLRLAGVAALVFSALAASGAIIAPSGLTFTPGSTYIPSLPRV